LLEGTDVDVGVKLIDCGGWDVTEFHDHAVLAQPTAAAVRLLAEQGAGRLHEWAGRFPQRWAHLMAQGLAYQAGDPPAYYYALFKTVDGNMRAYVRAGGPAYAAGMRTNDVIEKLDGLYWWEYGTFQTQARAYDGRPHRFEIQREGQTLQVQLGEAFTT
jgi:S1-C subfamily serine protease